MRNKKIKLIVSLFMFLFVSCFVFNRVHVLYGNSFNGASISMVSDTSKIGKPTLVKDKYIYTGKEITFLFNGFDADVMSVTNNKKTNAGTYTITVSLNNSDYSWVDGSKDDLSYEVEITKKNLYIDDQSKDVEVNYDGRDHTIKLNVEYEYGAVIRYMDGNGNYTLKSLPSYKAAGTYVTKYKVYKDDNYTEYYGSKTLTIISNTISYTSSNYSGVYDGNSHSISLNVTTPGATIKYSTDNKNYNLSSKPTFSSIGEYTIYYKISASGYTTVEGSNKVYIYGLQGFDQSLTINDDVIVVDGSSFNDLCKKIKSYSTSNNYAHYDSNGNVVTRDDIKTGDSLGIVLNGTSVGKWQLALIGDTSGDGKVNYLDYVNIYNHIQKLKNPSSDKTLLKNEYLLAADIDKDGNVNYLDYVLLYNTINN